MAASSAQRSLKGSVQGPPAAIAWSGSPEDRQALALRSDWSDLRSLEQLWPVLAERYGDSLALDAPHARPPQRFSYRELQRAIEQAAAGFAALGIGAGDVVALFAENSPRWLVADQALMRLGAADAVRGSSAPAEELRYIAADSGAVALVLESAALLESLQLGSELLACLQAVVLLQGEPPASAPNGLPCLSWQQLMERGAAAATPAWPPADAQRLATVLYTSGTTGQPKGVPLSHANLLHQLRHLGVAVAPQPGDAVLSVLPIWHAYERSAEYFLLSCGCAQTYTTLKQLRPDLQRVRPQYLISVPRLWEALLSGFDDALAAIGSLRCLRDGVDRELHEIAALSSRHTQKVLECGIQEHGQFLCAGLTEFSKLLRQPCESRPGTRRPQESPRGPE